MPSPAPPDKTAKPARDGAVRYRIRHSSAYRYGNDIMLAHHLLHLTPRATPGQRVTGFRMDDRSAPVGHEPNIAIISAIPKSIWRCTSRTGS
jgi:hypothetical protein